jgi:rod shape-determining protein MreC
MQRGLGYGQDAQRFQAAEKNFDRVVQYLVLSTQREDQSQILLLGTKCQVLGTGNCIMESVFGRYRNLTILVGVLFLQILGLAVQVKRSNDAQHTRLIRIWVVDAVTPFERILVRGQNGTDNLWHNYFFLRGVRAENRQLKQQIEELRLEQVRLNEDAAQAHRLQALLAFKEQYVAKTVPAQVIGSSGSDLSRSVYIDKGSNDGVAPDMPVITAGGIVGKVLHVYPSTSLVLMVNDQSSGVGVLLEKSRLQGVLHGTPDGELLVDRVMSDEQVSPGETVLSSGGDQVFPKGLPVGTVTEVRPGKELFLKIKVKPAADLSRLEEVLVVTEKQQAAPVAESGTHMRAADILAQRLPSVPDKPPAAATPANGAKATPQPESATANPLAPGTVKSSTAAATKPAFPSVPSGVPALTPVNAGSHASHPIIVDTVKTADRTPGANSGMGVAPAPGENNAEPAAKSAPVKSAPVKPVLPKPAASQSVGPPAATEDNPH